MAQKIRTLTSPDGIIHGMISPANKLSNPLTNHLAYQNQPVLKEGVIGIEIIGSQLSTRWEITGKKQNRSNAIWKPAYSERKEITDHYNNLTLTFGAVNSDAKIIVDFRACNKCIAYKYIVGNRQNTNPLTLKAVRLAFGFGANDSTWASTTAQEFIRSNPLMKLRRWLSIRLLSKFETKCLWPWVRLP